MPMDQRAPKKTGLSAMLPSAQIHAFTQASHTQDVMESLSGDWRFGRVGIEVKGASLDDAIALYATAKSPHVVVIQTDDTGDDFRAKLEQLAAVCAEGTSALVIGPINDVQLYRTLTGLGVSDYLVHPVSLYDMAEALSRTLLSMMGAADSLLIAIVGSKGGVGTTNVAHLAASISADVLGQKTVLIDAAAGYSTLWAQFGHNPTGSLIEAAKAAIDRDHDTLSRILVSVSDNLTFLNTGAEPMLNNPSQQKLFEMFLDRLLGQYPVVICDLSATSSAIQADVLARAHGVVVVSTPTVNALSLTRTLAKEILATRGGVDDAVRLVINRRGEAAPYEVPDSDVGIAVDLPIAASLPYTPKHFLRCESEGVRPGDGAEGQKLQQSIKAIMMYYLGVTATDDDSDNDDKGSSFIPSFIKKLGARG